MDSVHQIESISQENEILDRTLDIAIAKHYFGYTNVRRTHRGAWYGNEPGNPVPNAVPPFHSHFPEAWKLVRDVILPNVSDFSLAHSNVLDSWTCGWVRDRTVHAAVAPTPELAICHCAMSEVEGRGSPLPGGEGEKEKDGNSNT